MAVIKQHYRTNYTVPKNAGELIRYIAEDIDTHRKRFIAAGAVPVLTAVLDEYDTDKISGEDENYVEKNNICRSCGFARGALCNYYDPETGIDHRYEE